MQDQTATVPAASAEGERWIHWIRGFRQRPIYGKLITFAQALSDFVVVFCSYSASYALYTQVLQKPSPQSLFEYVGFTTAASLIYVFVLDRVGLYRREVSLLNIKELRGVFRAGIYSAALILSGSFYLKTFDFSRLTLTVAFISTPVFLYLNRQIFYQMHLRIHQRGWAQKRIVIFGAGNIGTHLARRIFESPTLGLLPIGFLDDQVDRHGSQVRWSGIGPKLGLPVMGGEEVLARARDLRFDMVLIALPSASFDRNQKLVEACVAQGIEYSIVPNAYERFIQRIEMYEIGGIPLMRRRNRPVSWLYLVMKRIVDFTVASILITLFSPFIVIFAVLIKSGSPGPVIFKQKRVGLRGREFSFYKFRTMFIDAPKYAQSPQSQHDPRITSIGRWLRRTSLDELPQLFNVWRGDMSIVGPRPEMPFIVATYSPLHRQRLDAKPGITGVWQISAVRGEPIHANMEYDLFYLENRSLLLDFAIIIKTALSVIRGIGAV